MPKTRKCPECGAENPSLNLFCESCGCEMDAASVPPVSGGGLRCPNGHSVSDVSLGFCDVCGEKLVDGASSASHPGVVSASASEPAPVPAGKVCPNCGEPLTPGMSFCECCGIKIDTEGSHVHDHEYHYGCLPDPEPLPMPVKPMPAKPVTPGKVCPNCGEPVAPEDEYCVSCGQKITGSGPIEDKHKKRPEIETKPAHISGTVVPNGMHRPGENDLKNLMR